MLWRWEEGRQGSGYRKLLLASSSRFKFDCYLIEMGEGIDVPMHRDPCPPGFEHHRINITLKFPAIGGYTLVATDETAVKVRLLEQRAYRFRPDLYSHMVSRVVRGKLLLLSFGWLRTAHR